MSSELDEKEALDKLHCITTSIKLMVVALSDLYSIMAKMKRDGHYEAVRPVENWANDVHAMLLRQYGLEE